MTLLPPSSSPAAAPLVRFEAVVKRFPGQPLARAAVDGVTLDIAANEFFALLGPSGCGKTTLLRLLAGFETPDGGRVLLDGADLAAVPPHRRPVNMMFQNYALFPHLTVEGNIAFGLRRDGVVRPEIAARVAEMMALVRLEGLEKRRPDALSGGQRQRVALARALIKRPRVLLLDEPLGALDRRLREDTRFELMAVQKRLGLTFIIVTHDQDEAMGVADRIGVMKDGQLVQVGAPRTVYEHPSTRWVADFIGDVNILEGTVRAVDAGEVQVDGANGEALRVATETTHAAGEAVFIAVRPERMQLAPAAVGAPAHNTLGGTVVEVSYLGQHTLFKVRSDRGALMKIARANAAVTTDVNFAAGDAVQVSWRADGARLLTR